MTDRALIRAAVRALTEGNQAAFGRLVGMTADNVSMRLSATKGIIELERRMYRMIVEDPEGMRERLIRASSAA